MHLAQIWHHVSILRGKDASRSRLCEGGPHPVSVRVAVVRVPRCMRVPAVLMGLETGFAERYFGERIVSNCMYCSIHHLCTGCHVPRGLHVLYTAGMLIG